MIYIGADPGKHGGIAILNSDGRLARFADLPNPRVMPIDADDNIDAREIAAVAQGLSLVDSVCAVVERVASRPGQGVCSMFTFGKGYGMVLGALAACGVRVELVTPQAWKKVVLAGTAKDKDAAIAYCQRAFPDALLIPKGCRKPHDGIADSLCLAEYGRRMFK